MNTYKYRIQILILSFAAIFLNSCSIDDIEPINQLIAENTVRDERSAQQVLNGIYDLGREFDVSGFPIYVGAYGNEGVITGFLAGGSTAYNNNNVPVVNNYLANYYNGKYKIINTANFLIQELEAGKASNITEERKNSMIAEAKFQRALHYFELLRTFGQFYDLSSEFGIVITTDFSTSAVGQARSSVQDSYNLIIEDLEFAALNGPVFIEHFYSGSLAAKALLSKVQLYLGNYERAATLALEVINNNEGYALEQNYSDVFLNRFNSSEVIFAPFAGPAPEGGTQMSQINRTSFSSSLNSLADAQIGTNSDGSLMGTGNNYDPRFSYAYSDATKGVRTNGKYPFNDLTNSENNTLYYLRLSEIFLIHAEAETRKAVPDYTSALNSLNIIRNRAGVNPKSFLDQATLLEDIRNEKLLELFFENGEPYYDIVRFDRLGNLTASDIKSTLVSDTRFILPIPARALNGNNLLIQNPGY